MQVVTRENRTRRARNAAGDHPLHHTIFLPLGGVFSLHMARFLMLWFCLFVPAARACSVPVFRYALEHWPADPFQVTVFHRGVLSDAEKSLMKVDELANTSVRTVDLAHEPLDDMLDLWRQQKTETLPWVVVRYPATTGIRIPLISGPLSAETMKPLIDSPARQQIVERLAAGQSAIWVLVESGDKARDDGAAAVVEKRLEYLMGVLELPKLDEQDIANGLVSIKEEDLRLEFSFLRVSREDPAEKPFVQMLVNSEKDLSSIREPMVFPVFGRGRALYALVGAGIRHDTIDEAASFLIGKCSCQVKERNPGVDLLVRADWTKLVKTSPELARDLPSVAELTKFAPVAVTTASQPVDAAASEEPQGQRGTSVMLVLAYAVGPLLLGIAWILISKSRSQNRNL